MYIEKTWLTVADVAKHLSLSVEMIYKLVQKGEIPAIRIGSSWRISHEKLEQWLQSKDRLSHKSVFPPLIEETLTDFSDQLKKHYRKNFVGLYVYGSVARGTQDEESDVDLVILLQHLDDRWKEMKKIQKMAYSASFEKGRSLVLSVFVATESEFKSRKDPLFERIREEGKKAA